jgi:hypothetical protein
VACFSGKEGKGDEHSASEAEEIAFGEVAHAPPKATLKRRHWDEAQAMKAHRGRHKQMFLKHTAAADRKEEVHARERVQV